MDNKEFIEIVDEVIDLYEDGMKKNLTWEYNSLDLTWVRVLLQGIKAWIYKKLSLK